MRTGGTERRAVVIQQEPVHEEVVDSLRYALRANGVTPVIVLSERVRSRGDLFGTFTDYGADVRYVDFGSSDGAESVHEAVDAADLVVFNTFQLNGHAQWARRLGKPTLGVVHNPRLFVSQPDCMEFARTGQLALVTLAPHATVDLVSHDPGLFADTATIGAWMFPISAEHQLGSPPRTRVTIPGAVDFRNRDYRRVVELLPPLIAEVGPDRFEIAILGGGRDRAALEELVRERGLDGNVVFAELDGTDGQVRSATLYPELARSTFLLPLLPPDRSDYRQWKISAALSAAVGYSVPPILDRWTATAYDLPCVTYRTGEELAGLRRALTMDEKEVAELVAGLDAERHRMKARSVEEMGFALDRLFAAPAGAQRDTSGADDVRGFLEFTRRLLPWSHSQRMQDAWALWESGFRRDGYFVEFGAVDGVGQSNGYLLERLGWAGVAAEPNPAFSERLRRNRTCRVSTKCVFERTGDTVTFRAVSDRPALSTIDAYAGDDLHAERRSDYVEHEVETISLTDLLAEAGAPPVIDFLSIDTEGSELAILRAHDFDRYRFRCITVEHNEHQRAEIHELLRGLGYRRKWPELSGHDDWYVLEDAYPAWSAVGREAVLGAIEQVEPFPGNYSERFNHVRGYFGPDHEPPAMPAWGAAGPDAGPVAQLMARVLEQAADAAEDQVAARRRARRVFQTAANIEPVAALLSIGDREAPPLQQMETNLRVAIDSKDLSRARLADRIATDIPEGEELAVWVDATDVRSTLLDLGAALRRARVVAVATEAADATAADDGRWSPEAVSNHLISRGFVPVARGHKDADGTTRVIQVFVPAGLTGRPWFGRLVGRMLQPRP